jgi:hypothetical protein
VTYKDTEAGPSKHRETKYNPPWWHQTVVVDAVPGTL